MRWLYPLLLLGALLLLTCSSLAHAQQVPTITGVNPSNGTTSGGTRVILSGTDLTGATAVTIGGATVTNFTVADARTIIAHTSAHVAGAFNVVVTTQGGTATLANGFTYVTPAAPNLTDISPSSGTTAGGTSVTLSGTGLIGATSVTIGGTAATNITVVDDTTITVTTRAHVAGAFNVVVTTSDGTATLANGFTYVTSAPTVSGVSPNSGPTGGGTTVVITGTNLSGATAVSFGGTPARGFTVDSSSQITATAPPSSVGTVDVRVTTAGGTSATSAADQFTYINAPTITSVSPSSGPLAGGTPVVITGTNFSGATAVRFGGVWATGYTVNSSTQITATSPASSAGTVDVRVSTVGGTNATSAADQFTYIEKPAANSVSAIVSANSNANPITLSLGGGAATSVAVASAPSHGTASVSGKGITYTPTAGYSGPDSFTYTATNAGGTSAPATVTITVTAPTLVLTPATLSGGTAGAAYSGSLSTSGGTAPYTYAVTSSSLPPGVNLSSAGIFGGTPTASASYSFTVTATDANGATGSKAYTVVITEQIPTAGATSAVVAANSSANPITLSLSGGAATSVAVASAPSHGTATASGISIVYTPTSGYSGPDSFTYTATNAAGTSAPATATITVTAPTLVLTPATLSNGTVGSPYSATLSASGGTAPYSYAISAGSLPPGLTLNPAIAVISGTPTASGSYGFTVTATDANGATGSKAYTLVITEQIPAAGATSAVVAANSSSNPITLSLSGGEATSIAVASAPSHGTATASGISIVYTPTAGYSGPDSFTYTATNAAGTSAPATVTITVDKPIPSAPPVTVSTLANQPITIDAAANATAGPFTALAVSTQPSSGVVVVQGMHLIYTPVTTKAGPVGFSYTLSNSTGPSLPIPVTVQVNPVPMVLAPIQVTGEAAQALSVDITSGATGGPFMDAAILSITPANAGTAVLSSTPSAQGAAMQRMALRAAPTGNSYSIRFTPAAAFAGTAVVHYTLSNAFATSAPATLSVTVAPRLDPSADADVRGLVNAQIQAARRFATAQLSNYHQRLEQLRSPQRKAFSNQLNVVMPRAVGTTARDCQSLQNPLEQQACHTEASHSSSASQFNQGVRSDRAARAGLLNGSAGFTDSRAAADTTDTRLAMAGNGTRSDARHGVLPDMGGEGGAGGSGSSRPQWAFWTAGSVDFGFADTGLQQSGFRFTTSGVTMGADYLVTDQLAIGAGLGYGHDRTKIGDMGTRSSADSVSAAVYGSYSLGQGVYVDGVAGYNSMRFDSRRWVNAANEFAQGQRDGEQWFAALSAGYEYRDRQWLISPYGRVLMSSSKLKRFDETGAGINALTYFDQRVTTTSGVLGLRTEFSQETRWGVLQPFARVEVQHDFEGQSDARLSYADIVGLGSVYQISGTPYGRDRVQLGLGSKLKTKAGTWSLDFELMRSSGMLDRRARLMFTTRY